MVLSFGVLFLSFCIGGFAQEEESDIEEGLSLPSGFYFPSWDPQSKNDYVGVFPVSRRTGYYVYRTGQPAQLVEEISKSPFVFHSGPQFCGWIGLPSPGWFGCRLNPYVPDFPGFPETELSGLDSRSIHLEEGMSKREVLDSVGSPSRKIFLSVKEIWEYQSFSLLFESGALKEIR